MKLSAAAYPVTLVLATTLAGLPARAQNHITATLWSASDVLDSYQALSLKCIPQAMFADAQGVAIIPGVIKAGLGIGGRFGRGVVIPRSPDGGWGSPVFIALGGGSFGWQVGVQSTDIILIFKTRQSLDRLLRGKNKLTLGADVGVAAGPVGRQAEAGTDIQLRAEILSYSRSRGLFAGLALEGAAIISENEATAAFQQRPRPEDLVAADNLRKQLAVLSGGKGFVPAPVMTPPPGAVMTPPPGAVMTPPPGAVIAPAPRASVPPPVAPPQPGFQPLPSAPPGPTPVPVSPSQP